MDSRSAALRSLSSERHTNSWRLLLHIIIVLSSSADNDPNHGVHVVHQYPQEGTKCEESVETTIRKRRLLLCGGGRTVGRTLRVLRLSWSGINVCALKSG